MNSTWFQCNRKNVNGIWFVLNLTRYRSVTIIRAGDTLLLLTRILWQKWHLFQVWSHCNIYKLTQFILIRIASYPCWSTFAEKNQFTKTKNCIVETRFFNVYTYIYASYLLHAHKRKWKLMYIKASLTQGSGSALTNFPNASAIMPDSGRFVRIWNVLLNTSIAHWIKNPLRRTSEHNR